jgi:RNA polymerase sigma-70 factor (ECF subfamily)
VRSPALPGELVEAARAGDQEAFGRLVQALWNTLVAFARSVVGRTTDAQDVVQDALLVAWQELPALRNLERFRPWLWKIVYHKAVLHLHNRPPSVPLDAARHEAIHLVTPDIDIERALAVLSPAERATIYLSMVEDWRSHEIGAALGSNSVTVRVHRMRAIARLRKHFGVRQT